MRRLLLFVVPLLALAACRKDVVCPAGETACGGRCVSLTSDAANCGACGHACGPLEACGGGACGCAADVATCGSGVCTDLAHDPANCGACGAACGSAEYCSASVGSGSCTASCAAGFTACGRSCVDLQGDARNCGACGHACAPGESCRAGACAADVYVACYATGEVHAVAADLSAVGSPLSALGSPSFIAAQGSVVYAGNGYPAGGLAVIPVDPAIAGTFTPFPGSFDVEGVTLHGGAVLASNATAGTLVLLDGAGRVLDEIVLPGGAASNPHGAAVLGSTAYVALYGNGAAGSTPATGQAIAKVDLSALPGCLAGASRPCGTVTGTIDLLGVTGAADAGGYPFPTRVAVAGSKVLVALSNLKLGDCGGGFTAYCEPAGHGKLAIVDTAAGDAVSILDLGAGCGNPGDVVVRGATAWVSCGSYSFRTAAPGTVVAVDLSGTPKLSGTAVDASAIVPGTLAFCGAFGYVTDQASGAVLRFDPATLATGPKVDVCPLSATAGYALASDVACP